MVTKQGTAILFNAFSMETPKESFYDGLEIIGLQMPVPEAQPIVVRSPVFSGHTYEAEACRANLKTAGGLLSLLILHKVRGMIVTDEIDETFPTLLHVILLPTAQDAAGLSDLYSRSATIGSTFKALRAGK